MPYLHEMTCLHDIVPRHRTILPLLFSLNYTPECKVKGCHKQIKKIQSAPGGKVNIVGGHTISHSKQKKCIYTCPIPDSF
jgi:hypothetical protein